MLLLLLDVNIEHGRYCRAERAAASKAGFPDGQVPGPNRGQGGPRKHFSQRHSWDSMTSLHLPSTPWMPMINVK